MISASGLQFLKDLSENNNREWFQAHKEDYQKSREEVLRFTAETIKILSTIDAAVPANLSPEDCLMRIYRDIRFSKDKTPYKTNFGIAISPNGKNFNGPGYYIHLEPGKCFVGGGSWYPAPEQLKAIRQEIDYNSGEFSKIISAKPFRDTFKTLELEHSLKTVPKGYSADNELIQYLKLKSFVATKPVADKVVTRKDFQDTISQIFDSLYPLIVFLRKAVS